ncbi:MAG: FAD-dependent oxidoreductase [Myxococcales bacterium]|nr:FAD-dependent oxidoreductase [Myxococcales bacterium]
MRSQSKVVVIGGGVAGCSILYHLTKLGWSDVTLVEENELTSGSTWHAAGLCTQMISSWNLMKVLQYSLELFNTLEAETGQAVDFHACGSLRIGTSQDRVDEFHNRKGIAETLGLPFEVITPDRARELHPLANFDDAKAIAYIPTDGYVDPTGVTHALAKGATSRGAEINRNTSVKAIERSGDSWIVKTDKGDIRADVVVNAAGQWARQIGRMVGLELPIIPLEHHYLITEPLKVVQDLEVELPVLRDPDCSYYIREEGGGLLVGPFERNTVAWAVDGIPENFHSSLLEPAMERLEESLAGCAERVPAFADAPIRTIVNGPDGYTPDGHCLMGAAPGLKNFHVLAGFSIFGIVFSGGAGKYGAEWIIDGQPSDNMWELDVRRFDDYASSATYVVARGTEIYEREYAIHYPEEELPAGRPLKTGPLYDKLLAKGAVYGARFGWERPLWFAKQGPAEDEYSFRRSNWHDAVGEECRAVRSSLGVLDQSSFAKYQVSGPGAERFLDTLCANKLPKSTGRISLTQMCTPRGGIECDITVTKLGENHYYLVSAAATELHDYAWIERHLPEDGSVRLENTTSRVATLTLAGPHSRDLLQAQTDTDISNQAFRFFRCRDLRVGMAPVRTLRVSFVGELGYELHHPMEYQRYLYDLLMQEGEQYGIVDWGYRALDSMRLEKAYRLWGSDMSADWTPLEAGMERFVDFNKGDFIGRDALLRQKEAGVERTLSCLVIDAKDADARGFEPIFANGEAIAYAASGGYGHTLQKSIAFSYLPVAHSEPGTELEVAILGEKRAATVVEQPLYDAKNERLLG